MRISLLRLYNVMTHSNEYPGLEQALAWLAKARVIPGAAAALDKGIQEVGLSLRQAVATEIPAFSTSGNPQILPGLDHHAGEHISEIRRLFGGGQAGDFEFVRAHARLRAEQRFPLEAILHAYRCGHRILSHWMRDAAIAAAPSNAELTIPAIADLAIEYTNAISTILAAEYVAHARVLAEAESGRRTELLTILLTGFDESDGRVERMLKRAGFVEQRQSFCVVLAQSTDPHEMENPARAQRIIEAMTNATVTLRIRTLIGIRNNTVTAVFSGTRRLSGWTAPQAKLAARIQQALMLLGPAVLIGISSDQPSTAFIPKASQEASIALDFANVTDRVVLFSELPIRRLLLHRAGDYVQSALPAWIAEFSSADAKSRGALVQTLRAYADADMNILKAARSLKVHPNTIYARMQRIHSLTGLDSQRYHDLTELLLAADCGRF